MAIPNKNTGIEIKFINGDSKQGLESVTIPEKLKSWRFFKHQQTKMSSWEVYACIPIGLKNQFKCYQYSGEYLIWSKCYNDEPMALSALPRKYFPEIKPIIKEVDATQNANDAVHPYLNLIKIDGNEISIPAKLKNWKFFRWTGGTSRFYACSPLVRQNTYNTFYTDDKKHWFVFRKEPRLLSAFHGASPIEPKIIGGKITKSTLIFPNCLKEIEIYEAEAPNGTESLGVSIPASLKGWRFFDGVNNENILEVIVAEPMVGNAWQLYIYHTIENSQRHAGWSKWKKWIGIETFNSANDAVAQNFTDIQELEPTIKEKSIKFGKLEGYTINNQSQPKEGKMPLPKCLNEIKIHSMKSISIPLSLYQEKWLFYNGVNAKSGTVDLLTAKPSDFNSNSYQLYRWSGKHNKWNGVGGSFVLPLNYPTLTNITPITQISHPPFPKDSLGNELTCSQPQSKRKPFMDLSKVFGKIGKCPKGKFAMSVGGGVAIQRKNETFVVLDENNNPTNVDTLAMDLDIFYFCPTTLDQLQPNDVVVTGADGSVGFVTNVQDGSVNVYDVNSEVNKKVQPAKHFLFPAPFVTKVCSLLNFCGGQNPLLLMMLMSNKEGGDGMDMKSLVMMSMLGGGGLGGDGAMSNPLMLMMLCGGLGDKKDGKGLDMKQLLMFSMLSGQGLGVAGGHGAAAMNPLLLMMMLGDGNDKDDLLPLMLLSGQGGLGNGLGNLFGGGKKEHCCHGKKAEEVVEPAAKPAKK